MFVKSTGRHACPFTAYMLVVGTVNNQHQRKYVSHSRWVVTRNWIYRKKLGQAKIDEDGQEGCGGIGGG